MENGALPKWLSAIPCAPSWQVLDSGGEVRLTSSCSRQPYGVPSWAVCVVVAAVASGSPSTCWPLTGPQPPYRLSKEWFSS